MVHGPLGDVIIALVVNTETFSGLVPKLILSLSIVTLVALTFTLELLFMIVFLLDSMLIVSDFMLASFASMTVLPLLFMVTFESVVIVILFSLSRVILLPLLLLHMIIPLSLASVMLLLSLDMVIPISLSSIILFFNISLLLLSLF